MRPTVGFEEELFLLDRDTNLPPTRFTQACFDNFLQELTQGVSDEAAQGYYSKEIFPCLVELNTAYDTSIDKVIGNYHDLRRKLVERAQDRGFSLLATGTHPAADWSHYRLRDDLRTPTLYTLIGRSFLICGLHVHIGVADRDRRIWLMGLFRALSPLLLAATTSSPFWMGEETGLSSYRYFVFSALLRGGVPPALDNYATYAQYHAHLDAHKEEGELVNPQWIVRPNGSHDTVEVRIMDSNPDKKMVISAVSLIYCIACWALSYYPSFRKHGKSLFRIKIDSSVELLQFLIKQPEFMIRENLWQAARLGPNAQFSFMDTAADHLVRYSFSDLLSLIVQFIDKTSARVGIRDLVGGAGNYFLKENSATAQCRMYREELSGGNPDAALRQLVRGLAGKTMSP